MCSSDKKYLILLLLILQPWYCHADWGDFIAWLADPCNAGAANIEEHQDNSVIRSVKPNALCPPWNKPRPDNTCLIQFDYPRIFTPYYLNYCAESTSESNYFAPKIRIRYQACNFFACWNLAKTLNWDGECIIWPSGYAIPLVRICARVAVPAAPSAVIGAAPMPADPGYTKSEHLDAQGMTVPDTEIIDYKGVPFQIVAPKLCAYKDPSLIDTIIEGTLINMATAGVGVVVAGATGMLPIDLMDYNPVNQPIHNTGQVHPIAKVLIFLVKQMAGNYQSLGDMLGMVLDSIGGVIIPGIDVFKKIFDAVGAIIQYIGQVFIDIITEFGQFNRVVDAYLGCVELPQGPYPPPFCPKIEPFVPPPATQTICEIGGTDGSGNTVLTASTSSHACVASMLVNNFIRNSVRVTFDNFVPLCKSTNGKTPDPTQTDQCVVINNLNAFSSASAMHVTTANRDIIRACTNVPTGAPCVNTMIAEPTCNLSGTNSWCSGGFRVVYASVTGQSSVPSGYFYNDLPDCTSSTGGTNCQTIWGVNTGSFIDVSLIFPNIEIGYSTTPITTNFALNDTNGNSKSFQATIARQPTTPALSDSASSFQQQPNQICVFSENVLTGCQLRVPLQPQVTSNCTSSATSTTASNNSGVPAGTITTTSSTAADGSTITTTNSTSTDGTTTTTTITTSSCANSTRCVSATGGVVNCSGISSSPIVYSCDSAQANNLGLQCTNSFFVPEFVTAIYSGNDYTAAQFQPKAVDNADTTKYMVNLAGYDFTSFVTDSTLMQAPFSAGANSANPSSIYGKYLPGPVNNIAAPYTISGSTVTPVDGIYLSGLEYMNSKYVQGGTYVCLQEIGLDHCSTTNTTNCVLANLTNTNVINCRDFSSLTRTYPGLSLCTRNASTASCGGSIQTVNGTAAGSSSINIYKCTDSSSGTLVTSYCYSNSANVEICQVSTDNANRANPSPNSDLTAPLSASQYYDLNASNNAQYDMNLYAVRDKTPIELGLCTTITWPVCDAKSEANATWPATPLGQAVTGTCNTNYGTSRSLKRYCTTNLNDKSWGLTPLPSGVSCTYQSCPAITEANATWPQTVVGQQATGQCISGYSSYGVLQTRACNAASSSSTTWASLNSSQPTCQPGRVQFQNNNNYPSYPSWTDNNSYYRFGVDSCCIGGGNYSSTLTFYIADMSKVSSFYIIYMGYDDWLQIDVNGHNIWNDVGWWDTYENRHFSYIYFQQYLQNGMNTIQFNHQVYGGGNLYYDIRYQINN